jgi:hypothetical protein
MLRRFGGCGRTSKQRFPGLEKRGDRDGDGFIEYGRRSNVVSRVGHLLPVQNRKAVNLFDDVTDVDRRRRRAPLDDRAAMSPQIIRRDFSQ